jgi:hypothetical protein
MLHLLQALLFRLPQPVPGSPQRQRQACRLRRQVSSRTAIKQKYSIPQKRGQRWCEHKSSTSCIIIRLIRRIRLQAHAQPHTIGYTQLLHPVRAQSRKPIKYHGATTNRTKAIYPLL